MSRETIEWLNTMTKIGDTDRRGNAWHYRMGNTNHYPGAIPQEDVRELLLPYEPIEHPLYVKLLCSIDDADGLNDDGKPFKWHLIENFKAIASKDHPDVIHSIPTSDYGVHPFKHWLLDGVFALVDGNVHISSAGLLQKGAVAWVELSLHDSKQVSGFEYRPHLLASTSSNGRYRTEYGRKVQATVCDNTLDIAVGEQGASISFKHSKGSTMRIKDAQEALGLIVKAGEDFESEVRNLLDWRVSSKEFSRFLDLMVPVKDKEGNPLQNGALTRAENKRAEMAGMWRGDERVAPWSGTAFGVLQLNNTFFHHKRGAAGKTIRPERNMLSAISGETGKNDRIALDFLRQVSEPPVLVSV
jgi:phage/plasmid-like protein (TIGR03299 family)